MKLYAYRVNLTRKIAEATFDAEAMHKMLTRLTGSSRKQTNLLYYYDENSCWLLVQSDVPLDECRDIKLMKEFNIDNWFDHLSEGSTVHFQLTAVPKKKSCKTGKAVYLKTIDEQRSWVSERLEKHGFNASSIRATRKKNVYFTHDAASGGAASLSLHVFDIYGTVSDKDAFKNVWNNGLGWGKSYGSGMFVAMA